MSLRRTRAVLRKEFLHIVRDVRSLIMALAVPLVLLLLFGYALSLDVDRVPTLIYDADRTAASRELIQRFAGSRYFAIQGYVDNYRAIERAIDDNRILLGVAIPNDYAENLEGGRPAEVQLLLDGSDSNTASIALAYADSVVHTHALELRGLGRKLEAPIEARLRVWYNPALESKNYIVPGLIAVILAIIAALLTSLTIAREWEMGTMEQVLSTPLRPTELVLGKMLAYAVVGVVDTATAVAVGVLIFDVPFRGSLPLLALSACVFICGALFWGIFISAMARSQLLAFQAGLLSTFLPAFLLSGFVYAIENMPPVVQLITRIFPTRYFITMLKGIFLKGVGLEVLWVELGFLLVYGAIVYFAATQKLRQKVA